MRRPTKIVRCASVLLLAAVIGGCDSGTYDSTTMVANDDAQMNAAIERARQSVDQFIEVLGDPPDGASLFTVKKMYPTGGSSGEHIWIDSVRYEDGEFHGTISNDPEDIPNLQYGDAASVAKEDITDWMYLDADGSIVGGYTARVLYERMSDDERIATFGGPVEFRDLAE